MSAFAANDIFNQAIADERFKACPPHIIVPKDCTFICEAVLELAAEMVDKFSARGETIRAKAERCLNEVPRFRHELRKLLGNGDRQAVVLDEADGTAYPIFSEYWRTLQAVDVVETGWIRSDLLYEAYACEETPLSPT